ncbi:MAG: T9SS type A sorting domain-containing protein [Bacteroidetes bacterium]|nr:T9SS type A sorting domain-containing protein [Bacteroidota bacterium]
MKYRVVLFSSIFLLPILTLSQSNNALKFKSVNFDYVEINYSSDINPSGNFTVEFWAKTNGIPLENPGSPYSSRFSTEGLKGFVIYVDNTSHWLFQFGNGVGWESGIIGDVTDLTWTHIAVVLNNGTFEYYVNGTYTNLTDGRNFVANPSNVARIGAGDYDGSPEYYFNGEIDDVRFWNVARTAQQISDNKDNPLSLPQSGLVSYWKLDESGSSITASDAAGSNDGMLYNFAFDGGDGWVASNALLPVELTSFSAQRNGNSVNLVWNTATETNNFGFEIEKKQLLPSAANREFTKIGFVKGTGTSAVPQSYSFVDADAEGTVLYRLKQIDRDGKFSYSGTIEVNGAAPAKFSLEQNYPNPFNPSTVFTFQIPQDGNVSLKVYDNLGREAAIVMNEFKTAGQYSVAFNASQFASGMYYYMLKSGSFQSVKKMLLMK